MKSITFKGITALFDRFRGPNHVCYYCTEDCNCPGLHMMTDCEGCSTCRDRMGYPPSGTTSGTTKR